MLSPGGKIEWLCPNCRSVDIVGPMKGQVVLANVGECRRCNTWWSWRTRIKVSFKREAEKELEKERQNLYEAYQKATGKSIHAK